MVYCVNCGREITEEMIYCPYCGVAQKGVKRSEYEVSSDDLIKKIKELIHKGNVTRIIVKSEKGETLLEMPVTVGLIGALLAPWVAALGVIAAMVTKCKIIVEERGE
ncbi:MAG: DUF4342 domain-containing protein [Candidatus Bathyarchaeia archaeon]|nr:DUF4342 domain-containing protein [Candidatus Bathyarchaeota archaeon]